MKKLLFKLFLLFLLYLVPYVSAFGQPCETFMFNDFNGYCGNLLYKVCTAEMGCSESKDRYDIDFSATEKYEGLVEVQIYKFEVNEKKCDSCKKGGLREFASSNGVIKISRNVNAIQNGPLQFSEIGVNELQYKRKENEFSNPITMKFKAKKNGKGELKIKYYIGQMTQQDYYSFSISYNISGLADPVKKTWESYNKRGLDGWCEYVNQQLPDDPFVEEAKKKIARDDGIAWKNIEGSLAVKDYENYLERFKDCGELCINCKKAREKIRMLKNPPKVDDGSKKDREAFEQAKGRKDTTLYLSYIRDFPNGAYVQEAKDSIIRLKPITRGRLSEPDAERWMKIQFYNLADPRYDVPVVKSLFIRDSLFKSDGILFIKYGLEGKPSLTINDAKYPWKELRIEDLDNMLEAKIASWDSAAIELKIQLNKGVPPYRIEITDENGDLVFSKRDIRDTVIDIGQADLAAAKITGEYTLTVWDNSAEQAITAGTFRMKAQKEGWWKVATIGGGLLLASIVLVFLLIRRKSKKQRDMFDID